MPSLGMRMAEAEINASGGIMGRQVEIMSEDSVNPATAATKAQRMLEQDGAWYWSAKSTRLRR